MAVALLMHTLRVGEDSAEDSGQIVGVSPPFADFRRGQEPEGRRRMKFEVPSVKCLVKCRSYRSVLTLLQPLAFEWGKKEISWSGELTAACRKPPLV